jgi:hypothetical protein
MTQERTEPDATPRIGLDLGRQISDEPEGGAVGRGTRAQARTGSASAPMRSGRARAAQVIPRIIGTEQSAN